MIPHVDETEDHEAAFILAHPFDHPAAEVDKAERWVTHNERHVARREAVSS